MIRLLLPILLASLLCGSPALAADQARSGQIKGGQTRGELLYTMRCVACHTTEIHWRNKKSATDWNSLVAQVRHWQTSIGLGWSEDEIHDVAHYLNAVYYHFPVAGKKDNSKRDRVSQTVLPLD